MLIKLVYYMLTKLVYKISFFDKLNPSPRGKKKTTLKQLGLKQFYNLLFLNVKKNKHQQQITL